MNDPEKFTNSELGAPKRSSGEPGEPERSGGAPTGPVPNPAAAMASGPPDPEVLERPRRRQFSPEYKLRILEEAEERRRFGQSLGELLRREGLYSSHLRDWRAERARGALSAGRIEKRGPKPKEPNPLAKRVKELEHENRLLRQRLEEAKAIIELQKKVSEVLGISLQNPENGEKNS